MVVVPEVDIVAGTVARAGAGLAEALAAAAAEPAAAADAAEPEPADKKHYICVKNVSCKRIWK